MNKTTCTLHVIDEKEITGSITDFNHPRIRGAMRGIQILKASIGSIHCGTQNMNDTEYTTSFRCLTISCTNIASIVLVSLTNFKTLLLLANNLAGPLKKTWMLP